MRGFLLRRDSQYSSDAPWIHAFGEDDEFFPHPAFGEDDEFFRYPAFGEDDEFFPFPRCGEDDGAAFARDLMQFRRLGRPVPRPRRSRIAVATTSARTPVWWC